MDTRTEIILLGCGAGAGTSVVVIALVYSCTCGSARSCGSPSQLAEDTTVPFRQRVCLLRAVRRCCRQSSSREKNRATSHHLKGLRSGEACGPRTCATADRPQIVRRLPHVSLHVAQVTARVNQPKVEGAARDWPDGDWFDGNAPLFSGALRSRCSWRSKTCARWTSQMRSLSPLRLQ